jgi:3-methyladenine DNA glycosylase AlkD
VRDQTSSSIENPRRCAEILARLRALPSLKTGPIRAIRRDVSRQLKTLPGEGVVALAKLLVNTDATVRWVGYELIFHRRAALASIRTRDLRELGAGIASWGDVDAFACYLSGPAWRQRQVADKEILRWAKSENRWWRRAALVSTVPLNRPALGGSGDTMRTLLICRELVHDRDDMVVKALSWALRELTKHDKSSVRSFIRKHENSLAGLVKREVRCKLETGLKSARRTANRRLGKPGKK